MREKAVNRKLAKSFIGLVVILLVWAGATITTFASDWFGYDVALVAKKSVTLKTNLVEGMKVIGWKSSNPAVATVTQKGKVTAKKKGKVNIVCTVDRFGETDKAVYTVHVIDSKITKNDFKRYHISFQNGKESTSMITAMSQNSGIAWYFCETKGKRSTAFREDDSKYMTSPYRCLEVGKCTKADVINAFGNGKMKKVKFGSDKCLQSFCNSIKQDIESGRHMGDANKARKIVKRDCKKYFEYSYKSKYRIRCYFDKNNNLSMMCYVKNYEALDVDNLSDSSTYQNMYFSTYDVIIKD